MLRDCFGVAEASIEHGATVIISSSNEIRIQAAVSRLKSSYPSAIGRISGQQLDNGTPETAEKNLKRILDGCGQIDHIVWTAADSLAIKAIVDVDIEFIMNAGKTRFAGPILL